ncbi:response regulator transcription factor [Thermovenabulum sp.]|uniref:response regulator transcription factor n=1 Tax=Thermovenabulum sp. TaxID=3100335 RepID=UPI003C7DABA6
MIISAALFAFLGTLFVGSKILLQVKFLVPITTSAAGIGASILIGFWIEAYSKNTMQNIGLFYIFSVTTGSLVFAIIQFINFPWAVIFTSLLPLISAALLLFDKVIYESYNSEEISENFSVPFRLILIIVVFYLASGLMQWIIFVEGYFPSLNLYWLSTIVYGFGSCLAGFLLFRIPNFNLNYLYKPVLPLLGASFTLLPFSGGRLTTLIFGVFHNTAFALFDIYTMCILCLLANLVSKPIKLIARGYFFITSSIFLGEILTSRLFSMIPLIERKADTVAIGAALLMFISSGFIKEVPVERKEKEKTIISNFNANSDQPLLILESFAKRYKLTLREKEIFTLLLAGRNNPFIRDYLNITNNTLKTHLKNIYIKLDAKNRQEAISLFNKFSFEEKKHTAL